MFEIDMADLTYILDINNGEEKADNEMKYGFYVKIYFVNIVRLKYFLLKK